MSMTLENMSFEELVTTAKNLQKQYSGIENENTLLKSQKTSLESKIDRMQFQINQLTRLIYGSKRERFISNANHQQMELPFDVEQTEPVEEKTEEISYTRKKKERKNHPGRLSLPDHLPVEEIILEPVEDTTGLKCIGKEVTDKLEMIPAKLFIKRYIRPKYIRPQDDQNSDYKGIIAELPCFAIEKGIAGNGLLAQIMVDKYVDHLPIYRQVQRFARENIRIPSNTINGWQESVSRLLFPLFEKQKQLVLGQGYLQVDETPIRVLDKNVKGKCHQGYYWVYNSPLQNALFYDYRKGRGREGPKEMLENFKGYLQSDGYQVYDWFGKKKDISLLNCWAHARRYFEKAQAYDSKASGHVLKEIQKLYMIERFARNQGLTAAERKELRLEHALPILNDLGKWMAEHVKQTLPKSPLGEALQYTIPRWDNLLVYLYDGHLEIDNNLVENAIRPNALEERTTCLQGLMNPPREPPCYIHFLEHAKDTTLTPSNGLKMFWKESPNTKPAN
jgi:transposase